MIENWKPYIHPEDFDELKLFISNTENNIKERKILILYGQGSNGKTTFLNQLREHLGQFNVHSKQIGFLKRPSTGVSTKLIIVEDPLYHEFDDCVPHIKEYLSEDLIYRRPYTIQTKANIIMTTNNLDFFDNFTPATKLRFKIIRFTYKF